MTVATTLETPSMRTADFVEAVSNGNYRQLQLVDSDTAFIEALELDDNDRQRRKPVYGPLELAAMIVLSVPLYAMAITALVVTIRAY